jgi:arabinofuranosyltransferase
MRKHYPVAFAIAVATLAAIRAWTCDDAFITFRVVDQLAAGNGPVFNAGERVQVFTHPLWLLVLAAWHGTGASLYPGAMILSALLFAAGLAFLCAAFRDRPEGLAVALVTMFFTRPILDFATSGLETPATFLLFAGSTWALRSSRPRLALAFLALLPLNRLDLLPWALPFAWLASGSGWRSRARSLAAFAAPTLAWMMFATAYYGSPLPNTAIAKLGAGLADRIDQGFAYVAASLASDSGSLALVLVAPAMAIMQWRRRALSLEDRRFTAACAAASVIAIGYAIWAGGDFMLGRFVLPALWSLAAMLAVTLPSPLQSRVLRLRALAASLAVLAAMLVITGQSTTQTWIDLEERSFLRAVGFVGATDERRVYIPMLGAFAPHRAVLVHETAPASKEIRITAMLGGNSYQAPLEQRFSDVYALADPFLARVRPLPHGRPGHEFRPQPPGWTEWREPAHRFGEERLDRLAADLRAAHLSRDLWSGERWRAIARLMVFGQIDPHAMFVSGGGDHYRIVADVRRLFRPWSAARYVVWIRQQDPEHLAYFAEYPHGLDRDCKSVTVARADSETAGIRVAAGEPFELRCPKAAIGRDEILIRVGAWNDDPRNPRIAYDDAIEAVRPRLWWLSGFPGWLVQGWNETPDDALDAAFVLFAVAGWLAWRSLRSR